MAEDVRKWCMSRAGLIFRQVTLAEILIKGHIARCWVGTGRKIKQVLSEKCCCHLTLRSHIWIGSASRWSTAGCPCIGSQLCMHVHSVCFSPSMCPCMRMCVCVCSVLPLTASTARVFDVHGVIWTSRLQSVNIHMHAWVCLFSYMVTEVLRFSELYFIFPFDSVSAYSLHLHSFLDRSLFVLVCWFSGSVIFFMDHSHSLVCMHAHEPKFTWLKWYKCSVRVLIRVYKTSDTYSNVCFILYYNVLNHLMTS